MTIPIADKLSDIEVTTLVEITAEGVKYYYAERTDYAQDRSTGKNQLYQGKVISVGEISSSIDLESGSSQVGNLSVILDNTGRLQDIFKRDLYIEVEIYYCYSKDFSQIFAGFKGVMRNENYNSKQFSFEVVDLSEFYKTQSPPAKVTRTSFSQAFVSGIPDVIPDSTSFTDLALIQSYNYWKGDLVQIIEGTGSPQERGIVQFDSVNKKIYVDIEFDPSLSTLDSAFLITKYGIPEKSDAVGKPYPYSFGNVDRALAMWVGGVYKGIQDWYLLGGHEIYDEAILRDDFDDGSIDTNKWDVTGDYITEESGYLAVNGTGVSASYVTSKSDYSSENIMARVTAWGNTTSGADEEFLFEFYHASKKHGIYYVPDDGWKYIFNGGSLSTNWDLAPPDFYAGQKYVLTIKCFTDGKVEFRVDGKVRKTRTDGDIVDRNVRVGSCWIADFDDLIVRDFNSMAVYWGLDEAATADVASDLSNPIQSELYDVYSTVDNDDNTVTLLKLLGEDSEENPLNLGLGTSKVYVSFRGAKDTPVGKYSQLANSLIRNPAAVIYYFLDKFSNYGPYIDVDSVDKLFIARSGWFFDGQIDTLLGVDEWLAKLCFECASSYTWSAGKLKLKSIDMSSPVPKWDLVEGINILDEPEIDWAFTSPDSIKNDFTIKYHRNWPQDGFRNVAKYNRNNSILCEESYEKYAVTKEYQYESQFITEPGTIFKLGNHFQHLWCLRKVSTSITLTRNMEGIEKGDFARVTHSGAPSDPGYTGWSGKVVLITSVNHSSNKLSISFLEV